MKPWAARIAVAGAAGLSAAMSAADAEGGAEFWEEREAAYRESPRGPLTAIHAQYFERGNGVRLWADAGQVFGMVVDFERALEGDVEIPPGVPAIAVYLLEDGFRVAPVTGQAPPTKGGGAIRGWLLVGEEAGDQEDFRLGPFLLSFSMRDEDQGRVLVYDAARLRDFPGFPVFPDDDAYRVEAEVTPADGDTLLLGTTRGLVQPYVRAAHLEFSVGGTPCRLTGFREAGVNQGALFVPYRDATSGAGSYEVGRYLSVEPRENGTAPIDFNRSTNPWCAYAPLYDCPLPPEENVLAVEVRAGERAPEGH